MEKIEKVLTFDEMERDYKDLNLMLKHEKGMHKRGSAYVVLSCKDNELVNAAKYAQSLGFFVEFYRTNCDNTPFVSYMGEVYGAVGKE